MEIAYFAFEADDRGVIINPQKPLCRRCYLVLQIKGGNTSNLAKQLKDRHPDLFKEFKVSRSRRGAAPMLTSGIIQNKSMFVVVAAKF